MRTMKIDKPRIEWIIANLDEGKDRFVIELLDAIEVVFNTGEISALEQCIDEWETVAELDNIPGFKVKVWEKFNKLKAQGLLQ